MKTLSESPTIDASARVRDSTLGRYTEVQARASLTEVTSGDHCYVVHDTEIIDATFGKFCWIAAACRINPGNHPLDRAAPAEGRLQQAPVEQRPAHVR